MDTEFGANPEILFRAAKRRKFQRRRPENTTSQQEAQASNNDLPASQTPRDDSESGPNPDALRRRRLHRSRKSGIEFSTTSRPTPATSDQTNQPSQLATTEEEMESERLRARCDRFTAHTGQTVDVDKHMYGTPHFIIL